MNIKKNTPFATRLVLIGAVLFSALGAYVLVYVTLGVSDNRVSTNIEASRKSEISSVPTFKAKTSGFPGASFIRPETPEKVPAIEFSDAQGVKRNLDDFRGKIILLNLWATWCIPCREEMPSLDRLQKEMGSDQFVVIALSLDRAGKQAAEKFFSEIKVQHLQLYIDPTMKAGNALRAVGMPTTLLIDKDGYEIGRLPGPAEWDNATAKAVIREALN